jgi:hypothetical protein
MDKPSVSRNDADIDIAKLTAQTKFIRWQRDFRIIACSKDYWNLYTGQERLLTKPDRHTHTISTLIEEFRLDMDICDKQAKRAREATLFLYKFLDPVLRNILGRSFYGAPGEAFSAVKGTSGCPTRIAPFGRRTATSPMFAFPASGPCRSTTTNSCSALKISRTWAESAATCNSSFISLLVSISSTRRSSDLT